ncbi:methyl-accepting chemotaxis protein, partial [Aureimonas sp. AU22]|uniref:methyl-accepting chemotaxis protein n=1 Tax=Aureimonas sp. AU22 TaxID=1638162 RepID=UPI000A982CA3
MLHKVRIATKIALIALFISSIGLLSSIYASTVIRTADDDYSTMIAKLDQSTLFLSQTNRLLNTMGYGVYRSIAYSGKDASEAARITSEAIAKGHTFLAEVSTRLVDRKTQIDAIIGKFDRIADSIAKASKEGEADNNDAALSTMKGADGLIQDLSADIISLNEETAARVTARSDELTAGSYTASYVLIGGTLVSAVLGLIAALWVSTKGIVGPLNTIKDKMTELAAGKLDVEITGQDRRDEVGGMAKAVQVFKDAAIRNQRLESEAEASRRAEALRREAQAEADRAKARELEGFVADIEAGFVRLAAGDLTARMAKPVAPEFEPIRGQFNGSLEKLERTMGAVVGSIGTIRTGLAEINVASNDLAQRTEQQAASLEETV